MQNILFPNSGAYGYYPLSNFVSVVEAEQAVDSHYLPLTVQLSLQICFSDSKCFLQNMLYTLHITIGSHTDELHMLSVQRT